MFWSVKTYSFLDTYEGFNSSCYNLFLCPPPLSPPLILLPLLLLLLVLKHYTQLWTLASNTIFLHSQQCLTIACLFLFRLYVNPLQIHLPVFYVVFFFSFYFHCDCLNSFWHSSFLSSFTAIKLS